MALYQCFQFPGEQKKVVFLWQQNERDCRHCTANTGQALVLILLEVSFLSKFIFKYVCFTQMYICTAQCSVAMGLEEGFRSPGTGVSDGCELSGRCWNTNPESLEAQPVLLTPEPSLQSLARVILSLPTLRFSFSYTERLPRADRV